MVPRWSALQPSHGRLRMWMLAVPGSLWKSRHIIFPAFSCHLKNDLERRCWVSLHWPPPDLAREVLRAEQQSQPGKARKTALWKGFICGDPESPHHSCCRWRASPLPFVGREPIHLHLDCFGGWGMRGDGRRQDCHFLWLLKTKPHDDYSFLSPMPTLPCLGTFLQQPERNQQSLNILTLRMRLSQQNFGFENHSLYWNNCNWDTSSKDISLLKTAKRLRCSVFIPWQ